MLLVQNVIGNVLLFSLGVVFSIISLDFQWSFLPLNGTLLILYIIFLLMFTVWLASIGIQNVLGQNKPFTYNFEDQHYALGLLQRLYDFVRKTIEDSYGDYSINDETFTKDRGQKLKNIDERIEDFVNDIDQHFISKWYRNISNDEKFSRETRDLLDNVTRHFLQVAVQIDHKKLAHGIAVILFKHIRKFNMALKRQQKVGKSIEELYTFAHITTKNQNALEHFTCKITAKVTKQFINWELYNSLPCQTVVSILARKLVTYILIYVSQPAFVNYKFIEFVGSDKAKYGDDFETFDRISLSDVDLSKSPETAGDLKKRVSDEQKPKPGNDLEILAATPRVSPKRCSDVTTSNVQLDSMELHSANTNMQERDDPKSEKNVYVHSENASPIHAVSLPVKIYESKSANKTWSKSSDLECISLGQDLLVLDDITTPDIEIEDLIEKKLWKDNSDTVELEEKSNHMWSVPENVTDDVVEAKDVTVNTPSPNIPTFISNTMRPIGNVTASTLHNMKEFQQSTVNSVVKPVSHATSTAIHKIGDLQDEAAGVMEGIFDFGMAGKRKGLRLTGLQDTITDKYKLEKEKRDPQKSEMGKSKHQKPAKLMKVPHVPSEDTKTTDATEDTVWQNPLLLGDSPNFDNNILLEKPAAPKPHEIPRISTEDVVASPDLEYEETTDLATTTAKLRSLLQQKTSESNLTTPAVSPMPLDDDNVNKTPLEYTGNSIEDITEVDRTLPSLYKFCTRTATGVLQNTLNTIKTALPGNVSEVEQNGFSGSQQESLDNWCFISTEVKPDGFFECVQKLLNERKIFRTVDNAYEAVETLEDVGDHPDAEWRTSAGVFDDELDDLDSHVPITKTLVDIFCELMPDNNNLLVQESTVRAFLTLVGGVSEKNLNEVGESMVRSINRYIGALPDNLRRNTTAMTCDEYADIVLSSIPQAFKVALGAGVAGSMVKRLVSSFQSSRINEDIIVQVLELFSSLLIEAASNLSPTYSA